MLAGAKKRPKAISARKPQGEREQQADDGWVNSRVSAAAPAVLGDVPNLRALVAGRLFLLLGLTRDLPMLRKALCPGLTASETGVALAGAAHLAPPPRRIFYSEVLQGASSLSRSRSICIACKIRNHIYKV